MYTLLIKQFCRINRKRFPLTLLCCVAVLLLFSVAVSPEERALFANDDGLELFINACQYQGHNPSMIFSGYAEMTIVSRERGREFPNQLREEMVADAERRFQGNSRGLKMFMEDFEKHAYLIRKGGTTQRRIKILFLGNESESGWRRFESSYKRESDETWTQGIIGFRYGNGKTKGGDAIAVSRDPLVRNTTLGNLFIHVEEFSRFGRMRGEPSIMATLMMLDGTPSERFQFPASGIEKLRNLIREMSARDSSLQLFKIKGEVQYDPGRSTATIIESTFQGKVTQRYWIDAGRGYICPKIQIYDLATDGLLEEYSASDYFFHEASGLWFPEKYTVLRKHAASKEILEDCDYVIDPATFSMNQRVALQEFAVDVPEGEIVIDERTGTSYRAIAAGDLSYNDVNKFETLDWLEKIYPDIYEIPRNDRLDGFRIFCIVLGVALIFFGLSRIVINYFRNKNVLS